jgi:hypothetical protein
MHLRLFLALLLLWPFTGFSAAPSSPPKSCAAQAAREHGIQGGQRETDGSRFEKVSAGNGLAEADVHA